MDMGVYPTILFDLYFKDSNSWIVALCFLLNVAIVQLLHVDTPNKLIPTLELADVCSWLSLLTSDVHQYCICMGWVPLSLVAV